MPSRGRHQSTSKESLQTLKKIEALEGVIAVIIGRSYGGKSLGKTGRDGLVKVQAKQSGGLKAVTQTAKGLQEIFVRCKPETDAAVAEAIRRMR